MRITNLPKQPNVYIIIIIIIIIFWLYKTQRLFGFDETVQLLKNRFAFLIKTKNGNEPIREC